MQLNHLSKALLDKFLAYSNNSSKTAPMILIFSIAMGADYSFEVNSIETKAPTFFGHINLFLGSVPCAKHAACSYNDPLFLLLPLFLLCFRLQTSSKKSRLKEPFYAFYLLADSN